MKKWYIYFKGKFLAKKKYNTILLDGNTTDNIEDAHYLETELKAKQSVGGLNRGGRKDFTYKSHGRNRIKVKQKPDYIARPKRPRK